MAFVLPAFVGYYIGRRSAESKVYDVPDPSLLLLAPVQFYYGEYMGEPRRSTYSTKIIAN
jgi:hypothetical protein